jgi:xylulose-5-phosphate/fructose-6-phosphate phosphoketolase
MPGEVIDRPDPRALPSHLPELIDDLMVKLDRVSINKDAQDALCKFRRAANYIAAGMVF